MRELSESEAKEIVEEWVRINRCTRPADRERAEDCIRRIYDVVGVPPPARITWVGSPRAGMQLVIDRGWGKQAPVLYGQHQHYSWIAECQLDAFVRLGFKFDHDVTPLIEFPRHAGWAWLFSEEAIVSEKQSSIALDDEGRLHSVTGMALSYPDGWGVSSVHGVRVPHGWVTGEDRPPPDKVLAWQNVEERMALVTLYGWEKILPHIEAVTLDNDPVHGELMQATIAGEPQKFLRVKCPTGRFFVLAVPPSVKTAREARPGMWGEPEGFTWEAEA